MELIFRYKSVMDRDCYYPLNKPAKAILSLLKKRKCLVRSDINKLMDGGFECLYDTYEPEKE